MKKQFFALAALGLALISLARAKELPLSEQDLLALLPYDLGPATIDVSAYPSPHKETYELFMQKCSLCHTPARTINFPTVSQLDWTRFLMTMHGRAQGTLLETEEAQRLGEFLAYDSVIRKLNNPERFAQRQRQLDRRFEAVQKERARRQAQKKP